MKITNIAILTSDDGTNTESISQYFLDYIDTNISCIITDNTNSKISNKLRRYKREIHITQQYKEIDKILMDHKIDYIVLSNFTDKFPTNFGKKYDKKTITFSKEQTPNNITLKIKMNNGRTLFKKSQKITKNDTSFDISSKFTELLNNFYPNIIEKTIFNNGQI